MIIKNPNLLFWIKYNICYTRTVSTICPFFKYYVLSTLYMSDAKESVEEAGEKMKRGAKKAGHRMEEGAEEAKDKVD